MYYLIIFTTTFILSIFFTVIIKKIALRFNIVDLPDTRADARKIHKKITPLFGGTAIFFVFFIMLFFVREQLIAGDLNYQHWLGFFVGACLLIIGGFLDDKYNLKPGQQIIWPVLAAIVAIFGGIGIEKVTNPFGGLLHTDQLILPIFTWNNHLFCFSVIADVITFCWILGMTYTTKILDGLDGLVTGVTAIGGLIIFLFTMTTKYYQPDIALASLIFSAACFGFLIFNWHPAKIFLGEGGSVLLGYILSILAIISGGKIAIALLVMGIPILDVVWAIIRRLVSGKNPFKSSDKKHLHHRLLALGIGHRNTVLVFYLLAITFGISGLFLQSIGKFFALLILSAIMLLFVVVFTFMDRK